MILNSIAKSYIAGFLDGDGSVYVRLKRSDDYKFGYQICPYIVFYQKKSNAKFLNKIKEMLNVGYIRHRNDGITEYIIGDEISLKAIVKLLLPYAILKKKQLKIMKFVLDKKKHIKTQNDFLKICKEIDKFKNLNYSKKRTRVSKEVKEFLKAKINNPAETQS